MENNFSIRNLDENDSAWLREALPPGFSQNEFLKLLIKQARSHGENYPLLSAAKEKERVYGNLPFKFIDLFAGIGGFRCGMTAAGGQCVFTSEWDKYAAKTYQTWYGDEHIFTDDIRSISPAEVDSVIPDHDVLCAGFPCQPFSLAGVSKKNSLGKKHGFHDEKQGNLFFTLLDIIDAKRPPVLVLENVPNLLSHDKGNTWKVIESELVSRSYTVDKSVIDASPWVPQKRKRIFIICFDKAVFGNQERTSFVWPEPPSGPAPKLDSILDKYCSDKYMLSDKLWKYLQDYANKHRERGNGFGFGLNTGDDVARTMSARYHKDGSEILIDHKSFKNPRRLTPRESMRLMGYTDRYAKMFNHDGEFPQVVSDTQAYKQCGNSVVPAVVEAIAHNLTAVMASAILSRKNGCLLKT